MAGTLPEGPLHPVGMAFFERFREVLLVLDLEVDLETTLRLTELLSPAIERAHCLCLPVMRDGAIHESDAARDTDVAGAAGRSPGAFARLKAALLDWQQRCPGLAVSYTLEATLDAARIAKASDALQSDLVVLAPLRAHSKRDRANLMLRLSARHGRHVLSLGSGVRADPSQSRSLDQVVLAVDAKAASMPALTSFVSGLGSHAAITVLVAGASEMRRKELAAMFEAREPAHPVVVQALVASTTNLAEAVDHAAQRLSADLIVCAADAVSNLEAVALGFLAGSALQQAGCPVLVLPRTHDAPGYLKEHLVASDAFLAPDGDPRIAVERVGVFGRSALSAPDTLTVIEHGREHPPLPHDDGILALPRAWIANVPEHGLSIETQAHEIATARVLRPAKPIILLDAHLDSLPLSSMAGRATNHELVFVRMRRSDDLEDLRERLGAYREVLGAPFVVDASAWLDDGGAEDVPSLVDGQRLLRVALRMLARGLPIHALVTPTQHLRTHACHVLTAREWVTFDLGRGPASPPASQTLPGEDAALQRELDLCTNSLSTAGHAVRLVIDNAAARRDLLRLIAGARERVHWQCYIVEDDATTEELVEALAGAASRGVQVRFLADAVYSLHDAFGQTNSALARLATASGVSVRAFRPVAGLPSLTALKRRNHRKCIVVDGHTAVVTGRNLGAPYYCGFQEVRLDTMSKYRELPWLDCGAVLEGPLVSELDRSFAQDWQRAGGEAYPVADVAPEGRMHARLVLHDGLRDTHTFDAQLSLIRHAQHELVVVNTFPLVVELQRALVAALARGVRVRVLIGSVRPHFGDEVPFAGGSFRSLADQLVRSRLDAVVSAGGEVYEYAMPALPGWDPSLERVFPHVHAKLVMRDRTDVAIGSANLDVTAAYWESEAMLIVHDAVFAGAVAEDLRALFATSRLVDPDTESFRAEAVQRAWLSRYWPSLIG